MGSNFFNSRGFGRGPTLGKIGSTVMPVAKVLRFASPGANVAYNQGKAYQAGKIMPPSTGPYAGVTPTLADANRMYQPKPVTPAVATPAPVNGAWMGG